MQFGSNTLGGYLAAPEKLLKRFLNASTTVQRYRQFVNTDFQPGLNNGGTFTWVVNGKLGIAPILAEGSTVPSADFGMIKGSLTVNEEGQAVKYTKRLATLGELDARNIIDNVLAKNAGETLDFRAHAAYATTPLKIGAVGGNDPLNIVIANNGVAPTTNAVALSKSHLRQIILALKERNVPTLDDKYYGIARPATWEPIKIALEDVHKFTPAGFDKIVKGAVAEYDGLILIEQTNVKSQGWTSGLSDEAFFIGDEGVMEGVVISEELREKIPDDYGRGMGVMWYAMLGFGLMQPVDNFGATGVNAATGGPNDDGKRATVFHWTSVA